MTGFTVPITEPTTLYAGARWDWTKEVAEYPNDLYTLTYYLDGGSSVSAIAATATAGSTSNYTVSHPASSTSGYTAGTYKWQSRAALTLDTTDVHVVGSGVFYVAPDRAVTSAAQTHNEKMLAAIEATLESRSVADVESYQIDGRALNRIPFAQLMKYRGLYRQAVWRERNPGAANPGYLVHFGQA